MAAAKTQEALIYQLKANIFNGAGGATRQGQINEFCSRPAGQ